MVDQDTAKIEKIKTQIKAKREKLQERIKAAGTRMAVVQTKLMEGKAKLDKMDIPITENEMKLKEDHRINRMDGHKTNFSNMINKLQCSIDFLI